MKNFFYLSLILLLALVPADIKKEYGTNTAKNGSIFLLKIWSNYISPVDGPRCSLRPTCAQYAKEAINKYGPVKGSILASERLQRCHSCINIDIYPRTAEGYLADPVSANIHNQCSSCK